MAKRRTETWSTLVVLAIGLPIAVVVALVSYIASARPLHPNPQAVTSVMLSAPSPRWAAAIERGQKAARAGLSEENVPGLSVAVGIAGELVWAEGFGWANIETQAPVTPTTRFRIGHVSKSLTSAGAGLLIERGRLHLADEIQTYVPAFPRKQWPVTLRQLMGHVAGVRHYRNTEWGDKPKVKCERASEGVQSFANDPLLFEPETQYRYSTYGWVLVSAAVEAAANEPFSAFMQTQVFKPLGMADTSSEAATAPIPNRSTSYYRGNLGREITTNVDYSCFAGAGAFLSTPSDLVRFGIALGTDKLLQPSTVRMLQTPQQLASGKETDYGLGWMVETVELAGERTRLAGHASRTIEGASTSFMIFPERGIVVAVTANLSFSRMRAIALEVAQAFAEQEKRPAGK
ncbi:MAG TPA: serine hydrolase domain-containing protein [Vicinamibacterales bacterium]|nr:serine hydrolase domain-containing protein [Vicinamibacterales bacterium]